MLEHLLQRRPYNAVSDFVDANVERGLGDKAAFTDSERALTYAQLQARSCRVASALKAIGLNAENRVMLVLHDTVDYPVAFWGAIRAGIIPIPINTLLTAEQYAYLLADSRAAAVVVAAPLAGAAVRVASQFRRQSRWCPGCIFSPEQWPVLSVRDKELDLLGPQGDSSCVGCVGRQRARVQERVNPFIVETHDCTGARTAASRRAYLS